MSPAVFQVIEVEHRASRLVAQAPSCCHVLMQFNHYGGEAALLAADLVNLPPSSVAHDVAAVLTTHGVVDPKPTSDQARQLLGWAARLAPCFGTQHSHEQCRLVNELLATAASKPYISVHDGHRPHLH
ncbi:MAG: hypothetical protein ACREQ5_39480, partial [Candidatus Dormibacteria bacterium]